MEKFKKLFAMFLLVSILAAAFPEMTHAYGDYGVSADSHPQIVATVANVASSGYAKIRFKLLNNEALYRNRLDINGIACMQIGIELDSYVFDITNAWISYSWIDDAVFTNRNQNGKYVWAFGTSSSSALVNIPEYLFQITVKLNPGYNASNIPEDAFEYTDCEILYSKMKGGTIISHTVYGYGTNISDYELSVGTDNTFVPISVYERNQKKILKKLKINTGKLLSSISCGNHPIKGPSVTFQNRTFYLFEFDGKLNFDFGGLPVQAVVNTNAKTVNILIGFKDFDGHADIGADYNSNKYWSESYQQVKSMYQGITGKKVDNTKLWNQFSSLRGKLKKMNSSLVVDADCSVVGYIELGYETGVAKFSEGGIVMEASIGGEFTGRISAFPPAYVVLGLEASVGGKIIVAYDQYVSLLAQINTELAANVGVGLGDKKIIATYIEGGLRGVLGAEMKAGSGVFSDSITTPLTIYVRGDVYLKGAFLGFLNGEKTWPIGNPVQLYPRNEVSLMSLNMFEDTSIDDIIKNSTPLPRKYLNRISMMTIDDYDKLYSDKNVYDYNSPVLASFENGELMLIWVDDNGTKNDINKTSLMYSIFNGEEWSIPAEVFENGTYNGTPVIYAIEDSIHILWSKSKTVFDDNAELSDLIVDTELYYTCYSNGTFSEPVMLTDNELFEVNYAVVDNNEATAIAWVENTDNNPYMTSGENRLYIRKCENGIWQEKELIREGDEPIDEIILYYSDNTLNCAYTIVGSDSSTDIYNNQTLIDKGSYLNYENGVLYYLYDGQIMMYNIVEKEITKANVEGVNNFSVYNGNLYSLVSSGFKCELYESLKDNDGFTAWKQVTEFNKYIRDYCVTVDSIGEPVYALNLVDIQDGECIYGASELTVCKAKEIDAIKASAVYYDAQNINPGAVLSINVDVKNIGTTDLNGIIIELYDDTGSKLDSQNLDVVIPFGEEKTVVCYYNLPEDLSLHTVTINIVGAENERDTEDNKIIATIGYADIAVENFSVEKINNTAVIKGKLVNRGYTEAKNIIVSVCDSSISDDEISTISCGNIEAGATYDFVYDIPEEYLTIADKMTMYGLSFKAESDTDEWDYANNVTKVSFGELTEDTVTIMTGDRIVDIISADEFENYSISSPGYLLEGYYTNETFDDESKIITLPDDISGNITLYTRWVSENNCVSAEISNVDYVNNNIIISLDFDYVACDCNAIAALYDESGMAATVVKNLKQNDVQTDFEIPVNISKTYRVKVFFMNTDKMKPLTLPILETVSINNN